MKATRPIISNLFILLTLALQVFSAGAIEGLKLQIVCPDVVLTWPSVEGETYIVQCRPTLDTNSAWTTLTNSLPADTGTNLTTFVHSNRVDCPTGQIFGMVLAAGGDDNTSPLVTALTVEERMQLKQADEEARLNALYAKCQLEGREPYDWELKKQPPPPLSAEEVRAKILKARAERAAGLSSTSSEGPSGSGGGNGPEPECDDPEPGEGFYRVVRNGIHLFGLTNGTSLHGEVELPIEIGANINAEDILLLASGDNPAHSEITTNVEGQVVMRWNTQFVPNGEYSVWLEATEGFDSAVRGSARLVTVSNDLWFNDFHTSFGGQLWVLAKLQSANMDYEIALHDGASGDYLGRFIDATTDGTINFVWDLTDGQGYTFTNESFRADFYVSANSGPMTNVGSRFFGKEGASVGDYFVVARAEDFNELHENAYNNYHPSVYSGVVNVLGHPAANDPYTLSPGNIPLGDTTFQFLEAVKPDFFSYLTNLNYRNFFWLGHGSEVTLGYNIFGTGTNVDRVKVFAKEVAKMLGNGPTIRRHPYRLAFIYGCAAAKGRKWSNAFGIPREPVSTAYFQAKGVPARGFIANTGITPFFSEESQLYYGESLAVFHSLWMQDYPLNTCLFAATNAPGSGETRRALPTLTNAVWVIHGAQNLSRYGP